MRELNNKTKDEVKIVASKQIEKQLKYQNSFIVKPNQKVYELNPDTNDITLAQIEVVLNPFATGKKIDLYEGTTTGENKIEQRIVKKPNCLYVPAINLKNAQRKFVKEVSND